MSATIHPFAPTAAGVLRTDSGPAAAAPGAEGGDVAAAPRSAPSTLALQSAIRLMANHGRLAAAAAARGDKAREKRLLVQQGEILMTAGLQLIQEGSAP